MWYTMGMPQTNAHIGDLSDLPEPFKTKLQEAMRSPNCLSELGKLTHQFPEHVGKTLTVLALRVGIIKQNKRVAIHILNMARRNLTDDYNWLQFAAWTEIGILLSIFSLDLDF